MLIGTVFFAQVFGWFMQPTSPIITPSAGYVIAAAILTGVLAFFLLLRQPRAED